eukprot:2833243-Prymnesium_polylepis.3
MCLWWPPCGWGWERSSNDRWRSGEGRRYSQVFDDMPLGAEPPLAWVWFVSELRPRLLMEVPYLLVTRLTEC